MLRRIFKWAATLVLVGAGTASAVVPLQMNVQGSLLNNDGNPVNGTFTITFTLYSGQGAGATTVWTETIADVAASGGVFDEVLGGAATPLSAATFTANSQLWLGVKIVAGPGVPNGGQAELPRRPLTSVAYAMESQNAVSAASADNVTCTDCVSLSELGFDVATQAELDTALSQPATSALDLQCTACVATTELNFDVATQAELDSAVSTINSAISGVTGNVSTLTTTVGGINTTVGTLSTTVGGLTTTVGGLNTTVGGLNTTVGALSTTVGGLSTTVGGHGTDISQLKADVATLKTDVTGLKAEVTLSDLGCTAGQVAVVGAGGAWGCQAAPVGTPTTACQGDQKALQWDGSAWKCVTLSQTGLSIGSAKGFEARDSWGLVWDGLERQAGTWSQAKAYCESKAGRLPTASELWRVSGGQFSELGSTYETNYLWSLTPWNVNAGTIQYTGIRLTDGSTNNYTNTTSLAYRCVWPSNTTGRLSGTNCYGPPGSECWVAKGEAGRMNLDKYSRPKVTYQGATFDCAFYGAHLAHTNDYTENIPLGLPNDASNEWQWTSDHPVYSYADVVRWQNVATNYDATYSTYQSWAGREGNIYRFRCKGVGYEPGPNPNDTPSDIAWGSKFVGASTDLVSHTANPGQKLFWDALTDCFDRGGHVAHTRDYMELIRDGLPGGLGVTADSHNLWSSDFSYWWYSQIVRWPGVDLEYNGYHSRYVTWADPTPTKNYNYRCVWYPIDQDYTGPGTCNGTDQLPCYTTSKGGTVKSKMWADRFDRSPATFINATKACSAENGHLASAREMVELIRAGLPNGTGPNNYVWTADNGGNTDTNPALTIQLRWNGTEGTGFTVRTASGSNSGFDWVYRSTTTTKPYRCVWSNELK